MATKVHLEVLEIDCLATQQQFIPNEDEIYLMGLLANGTAKPSAVLVGDPLKTKNPGDTFEPLTMKVGDTVDITRASPVMFQSELDVDETDIVGIAVGAYNQSLSHQWAPYEKLVGDVIAVVGDALSAAGGGDGGKGGSGSGGSPVLKIVGAILKNVPGLIKDVSDLDKDRLIGSLELALEVPGMYPSNAFYTADMGNAGHYVARFRITRDDRDYRATTVALSSSATGPIGAGETAQISVTLHNTGRQKFTASTARLVTVVENPSAFPETYIEQANDWFQPVPLAGDAAPGADFTISFQAKAPADVATEQMFLALEVDGIGVVPLDGQHSIVLESGKMMALNVKETPRLPGVGGWYREQVAFAVSDASSGGAVPAIDVHVYADGKLVGDASKKYPQAVKVTGKPPNFQNVDAIPRVYELRAADFIPSVWSALG